MLARKDNNLIPKYIRQSIGFYIYFMGNKAIRGLFYGFNF